MSEEFVIGVKPRHFKIDTISVPSLPGMIGISSCPGMCEFSTLDLYDDRIENDLECIANWGAAVIVNLLESREIINLGVSTLSGRIVSRNILHVHLPMANNIVPDEGFEENWQLTGARILPFLHAGERILIHCKEGIGRSAIVAARLLIESGLDADAAIKTVRKVRPGSLMLSSQEKYCRFLAQIFSTANGGVLRS